MAKRARFYCLEVFGRQVAPWRATIEEARLDGLATGDVRLDPDGSMPVISPADIARVEVEEGSRPGDRIVDYTPG